MPRAGEEEMLPPKAVLDPDSRPGSKRLRPECRAISGPSGLSLCAKVPRLAVQLEFGGAALR